MIIATAGHVDHGKSTLIKTLTGVDTDRLPEEKQRGLSIDLGFAYLQHPLEDTCTLGFVDVPGHEKFVRNMIAGVGAVDVALLVVAADDGPMPQTREHLNILQLLGVRQIVAVISKSDLVDDQQLAFTKDQVRALLAELDFDDALIKTVSTDEPATTDQLRQHLFDLALAQKLKTTRGFFRLAVDRSFSVTGAGLVVTGTVLSGVVKEEDSLIQLSSGSKLRVRKIRAQSREATQASAGQRCALNITGSSLRQVIPGRGDCLTSNAALALTRVFDVSLRSLPAADKHRSEQVFKHWTAGHIHVATGSSICRVALLQSEALTGGETQFARVYCDKLIPAVNGDRFVLRDQSAKTTIAGGVVIDPLPPGRGRSTDRRLELLQAMHKPDPLAALEDLLGVCRNGIDLNQFSVRFNLTPEEMSDYCNELKIIECRLGVQWWGVGSDNWQALTVQLLESLRLWHQAHPLLLGVSVEQLGGRSTQRLAEPVVLKALQYLTDTGDVTSKGSIYRCTNWSATLDQEHEDLWVRVQSQIHAAGLVSPRVVELSEQLQLPADKMRKLLNLYVAHGRLYRVSDNRYYLPDTLLTLAALGNELAGDDNFTVAAYRDASNIGRNLVIELLEFFDRSRYTRRIDQHRVILRPAGEIFG